MMKKRITWFIAFLLILGLGANGQVTKKDLLGVWTINNNDSLYFKAGTIQMYQDANYRYGLETCRLIEWKVEKRKFRLLNIFTCSEQGTVSYTSPREKLKLRNKDGQQILEIKKSGHVMDAFLIMEFKELEVQRYPWEIKVLSMKRI